MGKLLEGLFPFFRPLNRNLPHLSHLIDGKFVDRHSFGAKHATCVQDDGIPGFVDADFLQGADDTFVSIGINSREIHEIVLFGHNLIILSLQKRKDVLLDILFHLLVEHCDFASDVSGR